MLDPTYNFSSSATPTVTGATISSQTVYVTGTSFGTDASAVTVTLTQTSSRRRRSVQKTENVNENENVKRIENVKAEVKPQNEDKDEREELDREYEVSEDGEKHARSGYRPKINSELFDKFDAVSDFWGFFTNTNAKTFEETKKLKAWKIGGSNPIKTTDETIEKDFSDKLRRKRDAVKARKGSSFNCTPSTVTEISFSCTYTDLPASTYSVSVTVGGLGEAEIVSGGSLSMTPTVTTFTPIEGSVHGGALLTITGSGFTPGDVNVTLDGQTCTVEDENATTSSSITCRTPPHATGSVPVVVTSAGVSTTASIDFTYDLSKTPNIISIS